MALYHRDIGFPDRLSLPKHRLQLRYSTHARKAAQDDRYGPITNLPTSLPVLRSSIVEAEVDQQGTSKLVVRVPYSEGLDLVLVIIPDGAGALVKTVWLNRSDDAHHTLRVGRYARIA